jgi:hypothetical protein
VRNNRARLAISRSVLPDQKDTKDDAQNESQSETDDHGEEARRVARRLVFEEKLRADDVAGAIGDKDLG